MSVADIETLLKEQYVDELPETFTKGTALCTQLMKAPNIEANTRAVVFNLEVAPGGDFKGQDFDGGALPLGTNMLTKKPTVTAIGTSQGWNVTNLMDWATRNNKLAVAPVLDKTMADMMENYQIYLDSLLNATSNDGTLDILLANSSGSTYTFDTTTSPFGGYLLVPGGKYDIYRTDNTTAASGNPYTIDPDGGLDVQSKTVTFTGAITGFTTEDRIVAQALHNGSFNSLAYHINGLTGLTWQGLSTDKIYARSQRVDGGNAKITGFIFRSLINAILKYKGDPQATKQLSVYWPYEQAQNYESTALDIGQFLYGMGSSAVNKDYDQLLGDAKISGKAPIVGNHADPTKVFMFNVNKFRWVVIKKLAMRPFVGGGFLHPVYSTSTGTELTSNSMYMEYMAQLGAVDVTGMGVVDSLQLPS